MVWCLLCLFVAAPSHYRDGINFEVDGTEIYTGFRHGFVCRVGDFAQVAAAARFEQKLKTMLPFEPGEWRRSGAEYAALSLFVGGVEVFA